MKGYTHITKEERFYIQKALREGKNKKEISEQLDRHPSSIGREMRRNMSCRSYLYTWELAQMFSQNRKGRKHRQRELKIQGDVEGQVTDLIKQYLSPEQVSGYLKKHHEISISHETIYRYIFSDPERKLELKPFLRQGAKMRRKRYGSGARASNIPNRRPIEDRPDIVETKSRLGDWECDTVVGKDRKSVLVTLVERKTLFTVCKKVSRKTSSEVRAAIVELLKPYKRKVKTLTFDNGSEFVEHEKIAKALNAETFFATPYHSWERGINENTNGLLRQFFPKGTDFAEVAKEEIKHAVELLNNRPRKTRGYKTPNQLFNRIFVPLI